MWTAERDGAIYDISSVRHKLCEVWLLFDRWRRGDRSDADVIWFFMRHATFIRNLHHMEYGNPREWV